MFTVSLASLSSLTLFWFLEHFFHCNFFTIDNKSGSCFLLLDEFCRLYCPWNLLLFFDFLNHLLLLKHWRLHPSSLVLNRCVLLLNQVFTSYITVGWSKANHRVESLGIILLMQVHSVWHHFFYVTNFNWHVGRQMTTVNFKTSWVVVHKRPDPDIFD